MVLGFGCPQFPALWCQALGRDHLVADIELGLAPGARQAQSTNYVAKGAVGQGDHEGEGERGSNLSGPGEHRGSLGAQGPSV